MFSGLWAKWLKSDRFGTTRRFRQGNPSRRKVTLQAETLEERATPANVDPTGGGQTFDNRQPFGVVTYAIAIDGVYPTIDGGHPNPTDPKTPSIPFAFPDPYQGEIIAIAGDYAPAPYAMIAAGQSLDIAGHTALFSLLGTTYGGDGISNFNLPDLRGRTPIGIGGPDFIEMGQKLGSESHPLSVAEMPAHQHSLASGQTQSTGGGQPIQDMAPALGLNPVIDGVGQVRWMATIRRPEFTVPANGQVLQIEENQGLFNIIGTKYGGDGTTFKLPDLQGRVVIDDGDGNGLTARPIGQTTGQGSKTLQVTNLPAHTHGIPNGGGSTGSTGGGQAINKMQPSIALNVQIAVAGLYPSPQNLVLDRSGLSAIDSSGRSLNEADAPAALSALTAEGIARWTAAGIDAEGIGKLQAATFQFGSLGAGVLASTAAGAVTIDLDAAGQTWFVDSTPSDDSEFGAVGGGLRATSLEAMSGIDLLTVILHEQGHLLGLGHAETAGDLMSGSFGGGARRLPTAEEASSAHGDAVAGELTLPYAAYIATIHFFAGAGDVDNFLPTSGGSDSRALHPELFNLIGTTYGSEDSTHFSLPEYRGRVIVGAGQGTGLSNYTRGQTGGQETVTLTVAQLPSHTHGLNASLSGNLFRDHDADHIQDAGEEGVANRSVFLDVDGNGNLDGGELSTVTGADGGFSFADVTPGSYTLRVAGVGFEVGVGADGEGTDLTLAVGDEPTGIKLGLRTLAVNSPLPVDPNVFDPPISDDETALIQGYYHALLGRDAEPAAIPGWVEVLRSQTGEAVIQGIINSSEFRGLQVVSYYEVILDRDGSPDEIDAWVRQMNDGLSSTGVLTAFLTSDEFVNRSGGTDQGFVENLYRVLLSREGDTDGVATWTNDLTSKTKTRAEVVAAILDSQESRDRSLASLYAQILNRAVDSSGQSAFASLAGDDGGLTQIIISMLLSEEFVAKRTV